MKNHVLDVHSLLRRLGWAFLSISLILFGWRNSAIPVADWLILLGVVVVLRSIFVHSKFARIFAIVFLVSLLLICPMFVLIGLALQKGYANLPLWVVFWIYLGLLTILEFQSE